MASYTKTAAKDGRRPTDSYQTQPAHNVRRGDNLETTNSARLAVWASESPPPAPANCEAIAADRWTRKIHQSLLVKGAVFCLQSTDGRTRYLQVTKVDLESTGRLDYVDFNFTVWKKPGDQ
jgi:hypothetical protein